MPEYRPRCYFMQGGRCTALKCTACTGCTFRKSGMEFLLARRNASLALARKGLEPVRIGDVMTVRRKEATR